MRLNNLKKIKLGILACLCMVAVSCGQPMKQTTVHMNDGKLTTSDEGIKPAAQLPTAPKQVHSTFENVCNAKREIKTVQNEDGSKTLLLHSFCIKNAFVDYDEAKQTMRFKGTADFEGYRNLKSYDFDVTGPLAKGRGNLRIADDQTPDKTADKPASKDPEFVAAAFCNQMSEADGKNTCGSFFIDLYVKVQGFDAELFDEQVTDCGKADQCLSVDASAKTELKDADSKKENKPVDTAKPLVKTEEKSDTSKTPEQKSGPVATDTSTSPDTVSPPVPLPKISPSAPVSDAKIVKDEEPVPSDFEVNPDDAEQEGADLTDAPSPYIALNTANKINSLIELFNPKSRNKDSILTQSPDQVKPEIKTRMPDPVDPRIAKNEFPFNIEVPTHGPMQVYGGGANGWLVNPTELLEPTEGEVQTYIIDTNTKNLKNRNYRKAFGAFYVVDFLKKLADFTYQVLNHPIRINDISLQRGGHLPPHSWHRVGLDADVEYSLIPQDVAHQMTPEQKWLIFQRVGASPLINGIFVDIKDKRAACAIANLRKDYDPTSKLAMRKLKVEPGHKTHFHLNFSCTYNEHCNQKEDGLRNQYDRNEHECLGYKMAPVAAAKLASKK